MVAYGSQFDHVTPSFEKHICATPETVSDAETVNVTAVVVVVALVVMVPVGGVLSTFDALQEYMGCVQVC